MKMVDSMSLESITIETMSHCEAEVIAKDIQGHDCLLKALDILERMRSNTFQAVVWGEGEYLGGIWYNPIYERWTAEIMEMEWHDAKGAAQIKEQLLEMTEISCDAGY
jgi:hypothetical protein